MSRTEKGSYQEWKKWDSGEDGIDYVDTMIASSPYQIKIIAKL